MHLNTFAEMPLATSYSPFSFLVVYSIVDPNILVMNMYMIWSHSKIVNYQDELRQAIVVLGINYSLVIDYYKQI